MATLRQILRTIVGQKIGLEDGGALILNLRNGKQVVLDSNTAQFATDPLTGGTVLVSPQGGTLGLGGFLPPVTNNLPKWRLALARARAGLAPAKIVMLGDSTTLGSGGTGTSGYQSTTRSVSPAVKLASKLAQIGLNVRADSVLGSGNLASYGTSYDPRFTFVGAWNFATTLNQSYGGCFKSSTSGDTVTVTPTSNWTHAKVWYAQSGTQGTFQLQIDGGTPTAISTTILATQQTYADICVAQAGANVVSLDSWRRFVSYELNTGMYADTIHPNGLGYNDHVLSMLGAVAVA